MRKKILTLIFLIISSPIFSAPGRLQGFTYATDEYGNMKIKDETIYFNELPPEYYTDPIFPHYLNDDLSDARTGVSQSGDKYDLTPVYSTQDLYDGKYNNYESGYIEDEYYEDDYYGEEEFYEDDGEYYEDEAY